MAQDEQIATWLASQYDSMVALLRTIVNIDSNSYDKQGADAVGDVLHRFLAAHGVPAEVIEQPRHGDVLRARVPWESPAHKAGGTVLLMGHRDTVFPDGEAARRPFSVRGSRAYGPGVADMKGGLVMNCFVLAALARFGGAPGPVVGLFTSDEEIASPEGRPAVEAEARAARAVFNSEPGRGSGAVVTGRKGGVFMTFRITGRAAHSGTNFADGISAIEELARKVQALHALTDPDRGITVNVGLVRGGQSVNTVAPIAEGQLDIRYVRPEDRNEVVARAEAIIARSFLPGTQAKPELRGEFLPLRQTPESALLFKLYAGAAEASGFAPSGEFTGGCADSGFAAGVGAPTICAVGPVGGDAHTEDEFLELDSLVPRAQACARTILRLGQAGCSPVVQYRRD